MAVSGKNRHYLMKDVRRRHFNAMAAQCFYGPMVEAIIEDILDRAGRDRGCDCEFATRLSCSGCGRHPEGLADSAKRLHAMPANSRQFRQRRKSVRKCTSVPAIAWQSLRGFQAAAGAMQW